jgi:hypothetical protein
MTIPNLATAGAASRPSSPARDQIGTVPMESAVSWSAVFAGAAATAALSLILLILGTGLGLSSVSPWAHDGVSASAIGISAILWITVSQVLASAAGGYIAGRSRFQWSGIHTDEIYFRDTVHGFLAWAVASLVTAALLTSVIGSIIGTGVQVGAAITGGAAPAATRSASMPAMEGMSGRQGSINYAVDALFRRDPGATTAPDNASAGNTGTNALPGTDRSNASSINESGRIFMMAMNTGALPPEDIRHLGQIVAQRTGLSQRDAEARVTSAFANVQTKLRDVETVAREAADTARKASAYSALWLFISLLIGAFVASLAATYGARHRSMWSQA